MNLKSTYDRCAAFTETSRGKQLVRYVRIIFVAGIVGLLLYQLSGIGWNDIWRALPTQPLYYVILLAMYLLLPVTESLIYGRLWHIRARRCLSIMIRKRVLNLDVIGYSGEVYLFVWAKDRLPIPKREIMATIKDNLILSSAASLTTAALLLTGLVAAGQLDLSRFIENPSPIYAAIGVVAALVVVVLAIRFRRTIFSLRRRVLAAVGATHLGRFLAGYALLVAQWWVVLPSASFETWAVLLSVLVLINRIPFLPSSDLVFVSAGAGLSPMLDVPVAPVVGMLLVRSVIDRLLNLVLFSATVWRERHPLYNQAERNGPSEGSAIVERPETDDEIPIRLNT